MTLSVVTGCIGRVDITRRFVNSLIATSAFNHELVVVSNGSTEKENDELAHLLAEAHGKGWKVRPLEYDKPLGTSRTFNAGVREASNSVVVCLQNDLLIKQAGWDVLVERFYAEMPRVGISGMAGGKRIGTPDLYQAPYQLQQLARGDVYSSLEDWPSHGKKANVPVQVIVLDGIAMMMRKTAWEALGGFDERYFHHMYDIDLSVTAHMAGVHNYVIPILCQHLNGQTVNVSQVYANAVADRGGDAGVHAESHQLFYEKWRGVLPLVIP